MSLTTITRYTDLLGHTWCLERRTGANGQAEYYLTSPDGVRRPVRQEVVR